MNRRHAAAIVVAVALATSCESGPPEAPPERPPPPLPQKEIVSLWPRDMAEQVTRRPVFKWKLPPQVAGPSLVSFTLAEAGDGDRPVRDERRQQRAAFASGLHAESPEGLNPWNPPPGCVLTGELRGAAQLKPNTWYRWSVRALSDTGAVHAAFYFRTRSESAAPEP